MAAFCVLAMALVLMFMDLGVTSLPSFDDAYHAQTAKEMLQRGDPITITYGGAPNFESSPLQLWLISLSYLLFCIGEYAARLPSALLGYATVLMVYLFGRKRWGETAGMSAAFILSTTILFLRYSRHVMMEVPLAFFVTAAFFCLSAALKKSSWYYCFGLATGLAILTKSGLGLLPIIIAPIFFVAAGRAREMLRIQFIASLAIAVAVAGAWYIPAILINGQGFIDSHIGSYLATHTFKGHHAELGVWGFFFYFVWLPVQYLPWSILLVPALIWGLAHWRRDEDVPLLWLVVMVPVVLLSLITSKYTRYLMPIFPAAALLISAIWMRRLPESWAGRLHIGMGVISAVAAAALVIFPFQLSEDRNAEVKELAHAIEANAHREEPVANLRLDLYNYQNPLLFYTGRLLHQPCDEPEQLWADLPAGADRYALAGRGDYEEAAKEIDASLDIDEIDCADDLVFFKIRRLGGGDWEEELQQLAPLIVRLESVNRLGCYRLPYDTLRQAVKRTTGKRILPTDEVPRQMIRTMLERHETTTGLAWSAAFGELCKLPKGLPRVIPLAETEHLVLFRIEPHGNSED